MIPSLAAPDTEKNPPEGQRIGMRSAPARVEIAPLAARFCRTFVPPFVPIVNGRYCKGKIVGDNGPCRNLTELGIMLRSAFACHVGPKPSSRRSEAKEHSVTPHLLQADFWGSQRTPEPKYHCNPVPAFAYLAPYAGTAAQNKLGRSTIVLPATELFL